MGSDKHNKNKKQRQDEKSSSKKIKKIENKKNKEFEKKKSQHILMDKNHMKGVNEEINKGKLKLTSKSLYKKVYHEYIFESMSDEELFDESNKEFIQQILTKLHICIDKDCPNPKCKNILYIYTTKKVGSTSLWGSVNLYLSDYFTTFHYHSAGYLEHAGIYGVSLTQLLKIFKMYNKNVFVIDIFRPVFDTCASIFFNDSTIHFGRDFLQTDMENKNVSIKRFFNLFDHYYHKYNVDYFMEAYNIPDSKIKFPTFDFDKKHLFYDDGLIKYIKLRLCDSDEWDKILSPYFGYTFKMIKYNETTSKKWGDLYEYFKEKFKITPEIYEKLKNNEYFKYYYTPIEQEKYLKKLDDRIVNNNTETSNNVITKFPVVFTRNELELYYQLINENEVRQQYSHISTISNSPICGNCSCYTCMKKRKKLIRLYESNVN